MKLYPHLTYEKASNNHIVIVMNNRRIEEMKTHYYLGDDVYKYINNEFTLEKHWHFNYQILYIKKKHITLFIDGKYRKVSAGSFIFIEPLKIHSIYISNVKDTIFLKIVESFQADISYYNLLKHSDIQIPPIKKMSETQLYFNNRIITYFERLIELEDKCDELANIERKMLVDRIFFVLIKYFSSQDSKKDMNLNEFLLNYPNSNDNYWKLIISFINKNFSKKISLNNLSEIVGLSPNYISSYFKRKTGITVTSYIEQVRLSHTLKDLSNINLSVEEIAIKNGFADSKALNRILKKEFGKTAKNFRNQNYIGGEQNEI
ncbi:helix-turn-helix transcriptional regulator [Vagococcus fluvialis]|uniref:AraC family transcriptional regulator n=1 Tax=Vagococcus fluvialis TaxID=2738 RepID=UPI001A8CF16F|nr:AraC family transcriptional regulator [Vagococcus fluvialis]MBO0419432.1 helix-turn-helix transcriptional regulator [Vagococcus fluvialis]